MGNQHQTAGYQVHCVHVFFFRNRRNTEVGERKRYMIGNNVTCTSFLFGFSWVWVRHPRIPHQFGTRRFSPKTLKFFQKSEATGGL